MTQHYLNPGHIVPSGSEVWLIDQSESVAAVVDATGELSPLIRWPQSLSDLQYRYLADVVPDGVGVVIQCENTVSWVRRDGWVEHQVEEGHLAAADPEAAWFVDGARPEGSEAGWIVLVSRGGSRREITLPRPVGGVEFVGDDVVLTFNEPIVKHPTIRGGLRFEYPTSRWQLPRAQLLAGNIDLVAGPPAPPPSGVGRSSWSWLEPDRAVVLREGLRARGLVWWAGADLSGDRINRRAWITAHDRHDGREMFRLDAGPGLIAAMSVVGEEVWLSISRSRLLTVSRGQGTEVVAVTTDGRLRTVYAPNSLGYETDASDRVPRPSPAEIATHTESVRRMFSHLEEFWRDKDGATHPLSRGITDSAVRVTGDWPERAVVVTLRHPSRPGPLLKRTFRLYDEQGRQISHQYSDIGLMEDLDTGYITPADEAIDGILDI